MKKKKKKKIKKIFKKIHKQIREENFSKNLPMCYMDKKGNIVNEYKNGEIVIIKKAKK